MTTLPLDSTSRLADRALFWLSESLAQSIHVQEGAVWITQRSHPRDIVVEAGESVFLDRPQAAIVSAIGGPAVVEAHTVSALPADYAVAA